MFNKQQIESLKAKLDPKHVTQRTQSGRTLDYIEGWFAISEANRIFGFDGWNRETIVLDQIRPREIVKDRYNKDQWQVGYMAKVRITVGAIVREGTGFGSGAMGDLGAAIESAIKEAETDAMKRALMTFGNPFGLALYDKSRENVGVDEPEQEKQVVKVPPKNDTTRASYTAIEEDMRQNKTVDDLVRWGRDAEVKALIEKLPADWQQNVRDEFKSYMTALKTPVDQHGAG
jgi:DNA recombination protein Rad52